MNLSSFALLLTAALILPVPAHSDVSPCFQVTDLGALPGQPLTQAIACNDRGEVIGICWGNEKSSAFLWRAGKMRVLPILTGFTTMSPRAINNQGQIVGTAYGKIAWKQKRAFLWEHGVVRDLGTPTNEVSEASSINDRGEVVGTSYRTETRNDSENHIIHSYAFIWSKKDGLRRLDGLWLVDSSPSAINTSGQMTGGSFTLGFQEEKIRRAALPSDQQPYRGDILPTSAFLWKNETMHSLKLPFAWSSGGADINEQGEIVGVMSLYPDASQVSVIGTPAQADRILAAMRHSHHLFLWRNGETLDLGESSNATGLAINNRGEVVGSTLSASRAKPQAFLWRDGQKTLLNSRISVRKGWNLTAATDINNRGQIVGNGLHKGQRHAFLLTRR